jgi:hypothetical protein
LGAPPLRDSGPPCGLGRSASLPDRPDGLRPGSAGNSLQLTLRSGLARGNRILFSQLLLFAPIGIRNKSVNIIFVFSTFQRFN